MLGSIYNDLNCLCRTTPFPTYVGQALIISVVAGGLSGTLSYATGHEFTPGAMIGTMLTIVNLIEPIFHRMEDWYSRSNPVPLGSGRGSQPFLLAWISSHLPPTNPANVATAPTA